MKRMLLWLYMLNKRLYKRVTYVGILLLIFVAVCGFAVVSKSDSGFVHIALAQMPRGDGSSHALIEKLLTRDSIVRFTYMDHPTQGIEAVKSGAVDAVWIFPGTFTDIDGGIAPTVRVVEREQTVFLRLSREKLYALLLERSARVLFVEYSRENLPELNSLTDEELLTYFEHCKINEDLFLLDNPISATAEASSSNYLTAPLQGLLAVLCVLGGMAGVLYHLQDEERKVFSHLPLAKRPWIAMLTVFVSALNVGLASLLALWGSGLYALGLIEILNILLYVLCTVSFCMVLKELFCNIKIFGAMIPTVLIAMSLLCPVFFNLKQARWVSHLFPPTYYIYTSRNRNYLLYMLVYSVLGFILSRILRILKNAIHRHS